MITLYTEKKRTVYGKVSLSGMTGVVAAEAVPRLSDALTASSKLYRLVLRGVPILD